MAGEGAHIFWISTWQKSLKRSIACQLSSKKRQACMLKLHCAMARWHTHLTLPTTALLQLPPLPMRLRQ